MPDSGSFSVKMKRGGQAKLVVLANGLSVGLRRNLGIERQILSASHSISIGFDMVPVGRATFEFPALTYFSERPGDRIPYLTLFPIGNRMRANLFAYREADDPWLREMRKKPVETMNAVLPRLRRITGEYAVAGDVNDITLGRQPPRQGLGRIRERGLDHWADPMQSRPGEINHDDGGRGVYFPDPDGHLLEILTVPYGGWPA